MRTSAKISLLVFFFSLCAAAIFATHILGTRRTSPAPHELYTVISDQLAALRSADLVRAYRQSTSGIQQSFTVRQFQGMILRDFAAMTQAHRVEFGLVESGIGTAVVQVFIFASDGSVRPYLYSLVAEDGGWKIASVESLQALPRGRHLAGLHA